MQKSVTKFAESNVWKENRWNSVQSKKSLSLPNLVKVTTWLKNNKVQ